MTARTCQCEEPSVESSVVGGSSVSHCSKCGAQLFVTTQLSRIETDNTNYTIFLVAESEQTADQLKVIASVAGVNVVHVVHAGTRSGEQHCSDRRPR